MSIAIVLHKYKGFGFGVKSYTGDVHRSVIIKCGFVSANISNQSTYAFKALTSI